MWKSYFINLGMILFLILLNVNSVFSCFHPPYVETSPVNNPLHKDGYNLVFNDEFNESTLNYNLWKDSYDETRNLIGNKELEWYSRGNNFEFSSGVLSLVAKKETVYERVDWRGDTEILSDGKPNKRIFNYTSGMVKTPINYLHGYFEIKCKIPKGKGLWPAFWLYGRGSNNDEIDIFEFEGASPNIIHTNWHANGGQDTQPYQIINSDYADDVFYTYAVKWTPAEIVWYLNNKVLRRENHTYPVSMWVAANLAVASAHVYDGPPPSSANYFPAKFEIDYIRIYQKDVDVKPAISGPDQMVKNSYKDFQTRGYPNLNHSWSQIYGNNISNSQTGEIVSIRASEDGIMKVSLTTTLENGNKVSSSKNVLVVSSVPSKPSYINGPGTIIGSSSFKGSKKPTYVFPRTTYKSDIKPNASSYSWSISPNDGSVKLYPSGYSVTVHPMPSAYNRTYKLQLKDCNIIGCGPVLTKNIWVTCVGGPILKSTNIENDSLAIPALDKINSITSECEIYPNPAKDRLNISFAVEDNYNIELIDISGVVLKRLTSNNSNIIINTEEIPNGLYIIRINNIKEIWEYKVQILK